MWRTVDNEFPKPKLKKRRAPMQVLVLEAEEDHPASESLPEDATRYQELCRRMRQLADDMESLLGEDDEPTEEQPD